MDHFKVHLLNDKGIERAKLMQTKFEELVEVLKTECGCEEGRQLNLALTKLEEACFFAKKAMACNTANQQE